jgi:hypothetical protein
MTDHADEARSAAYAALVSALLSTRPDPATTRFDEELAAAESAGAIDPTVARTLRWWQREALRGVEDHLVAVLPELLTGLAGAERDAYEEVAASAESWAAASGAAAARSGAPPPGPVRADGDADSGGRGSSVVTSWADRADGPGAQPADPPGPHLRPVDVASPGAGGLPPAPPMLRPGFAPPEPVAPSASDTPADPPPEPPVAQDSRAGGAPPRRLLVAGLTVRTDDDRTPHRRSRTSHDDDSGTSG